MTVADGRTTGAQVARKQHGSSEPVRLDVAVANMLDGLSRSAARRLIQDGRVSVTGKTCRRGSSRLKRGDEVVVEIPASHGEVLEPSEVEYGVVLEDEHLIVVDKPAGVTVHPGAGHRGDTLVDALIASRPGLAGVGDPERPGIVHRLDKDTSGLLLVAKTESALSSLSAAIRARAVVRTYTALVAGRISPAQGVVEAPIGRDPANRTRQAVISSGKPARTRYRLVTSLSGASLLEVVLETGRMHQVRVHMAAMNHPVIGDRTYGRVLGPPGLERQFLHASRLEFQHPATGETVEAESELPTDLKQALAHYEPG